MRISILPVKLIPKLHHIIIINNAEIQEHVSIESIATQFGAIIVNKTDNKRM